jgi:hypothetical protein
MFNFGTRITISRENDPHAAAAVAAAAAAGGSITHLLQ